MRDSKPYQTTSNIFIVHLSIDKHAQIVTAFVCQAESTNFTVSSPFLPLHKHTNYILSTYHVPLHIHFTPHSTYTIHTQTCNKNTTHTYKNYTLIPNFLHTYTQNHFHHQAPPIEIETNQLTQKC